MKDKNNEDQNQRPNTPINVTDAQRLGQISNRPIRRQLTQEEINSVTYEILSSAIILLELDNEERPKKKQRKQ